MTDNQPSIQCRNRAFEKWVNASEGYGLAFARECWNAAWSEAWNDGYNRGLEVEDQRTPDLLLAKLEAMQAKENYSGHWRSGYITARQEAITIVRQHMGAVAPDGVLSREECGQKTHAARATNTASLRPLRCDPPPVQLAGGATASHSSGQAVAHSDDNAAPCSAQQSEISVVGNERFVELPEMLLNLLHQPNPTDPTRWDVKPGGHKEFSKLIASLKANPPKPVSVSLEKVARAIAVTGSDDKPEDATKEEWEWYVPQAIAALEAAGVGYAQD